MKNVTHSLETASTPNTETPIPWWKRPGVAITLGVLYCLSPIDVIPDVIPIIGWIDDIGVIAYVIKTVLGKGSKTA